MIGDRDGWRFPAEETLSEAQRPLRDFRNFLFLALEAIGLGTPSRRQYEVAHYLQHAPDDALVMGFRGLGKSVLTCIFVCWVLYWWRQARVIIVSASETRALANAQLIRKILREWELLKHLEPKGKTRDNQLAFDVEGALAKADTSIRALGVTGQVTGFHADLIVADDIEVPDNSGTPAAREKLAGRAAELSGAVRNPRGLVRALGTPQTEDSTYRRFPEHGYDLRVWPALFPDPGRARIMGSTLSPAIREELEGDPALVGKPTDPERFDEKALDRAQLKYGRQGFALQFMLDTTLADDDLYPLRLRDLIVMDVSGQVAPEQVVWSSDERRALTDIQCLGRDGDYFVEPMQIVGEWLPYEGAVLAVDPSGRGRDELAWACVKVLNGQLFLIDIGAELDGFEALPRIALAARQHAVNAVLTESNFGGGAYAKLLNDALRDVYPCEIIDIPNLTRKELRIIEAIEPVLQSHKLIVNAEVLRKDIRLAQAHGGEGWIYRSLCYQISRIKKEPRCLVHDDRIDALATAVRFYSDRVEANTARFIERRKQERQEQTLRDWLIDVGQDAGSLEPTATAGNRAIKFLRGGGL